MQRFADGENIVSEGLSCNNAYVFIAGKVTITKKINKNNRHNCQFRRGDVFGEMGLITNDICSAKAVFNGDVTIGIIEREKFEELMSFAPDDLRLILEVMVERLRVTTERLGVSG